MPADLAGHQGCSADHLANTVGCRRGTIGPKIVHAAYSRARRAGRKGRSVLILIAEEEMPTAAALEAALTEAGHQVLGPVDTIAEALPMIAVERPDLALVSILLKDGDTGVWLAWELLHQHGTPSIFLATDLPHARMSRDLALGVISKPYDSCHDGRHRQLFEAAQPKNGRPAAYRPSSRYSDRTDPKLPREVGRPWWRSLRSCYGRTSRWRV